MAGPGGKEVGRVTIRVAPDTSDFRAETRAGVEKETAGLEAEIPVEIDAAGLRQRLQAAVAAASAGIEARVGVDVDNISAALTSAVRGFRGNVEIDGDLSIDRAEIRQLAQQASREMQRSFRSGGFGGGGRGIGRTIFRIIPLLSQLSEQVTELGRTFASNFQAIRSNVDDLNGALRETADALNRVKNEVDDTSTARLRDDLTATSNAVEEIRDNLRDVSNDTKDVESTARNLPALWRASDQNVQDLSNSILNAAKRARELADETKRNQDLQDLYDRRAGEIRAELDLIPELDNSALGRFRTALRRALDTATADVDAGRIFVGTADGISEISKFENLVNRSRARIRTMAAELNRTLRLTDGLRFAFTGTITAIQDAPAAVYRIGRAVFDVRGAWERLTTTIVRARLAVDDVAGSTLRLGRSGLDRVQVILARGFVELDRVASGAFRAVGAGVGRLGVATNRAALFVEGLAVRTRDLSRTARDFSQTALLRSFIELDNVSRRALDGVRDGYTRAQVAANRFDLVTRDAARALTDGFQAVERTILRTTTAIRNLSVGDLAARWYDVRRATVEAIGASGRYATDFNSRFFDIRRSLLIAADGVTTFTRRFSDSDSIVRRLGASVRSISADDVYRSFIRAGDAAFVFGQRTANAVRGAGQAFSAFRNLGADSFRGLGSLASAAGSQIRDGIGNGARAAGNAIRSSFDNIGTLFRGIGTQVLAIVGTVAQLVAILALLGGVAFVFTILGAAITGAFAAIASAISALPAVLFLIAGPVAAIAAGIVGLRVAFETLRPEMDRLSAKTNEVFVQGLLPVLDRLRAVFPELETGLGKIATAVVGVIDGLTGVVTSEQGIANLRTTMDNVSVATGGLGDALATVLETLLLTGAQSGAFDAIIGGLQTFATEWQNSVVNLIQDGTLARSFQGLELLLGSLARALVGLIENGIRAFAAAAPGMAAGLDDLTDFFGRFDWERLGQAVGDVFRGLGESLRGVPTGTIEDITRGFEALGDTINSPAFQQMFTNLLDTIGPLITSLNGLIQMFLRVVSVLTGVGQIIGALADTIVLSAKVINDPFAAFDGAFTAGFEKARADLLEGWQKVQDGFSSGAQQFGATASAVTQTATKDIQVAMGFGLNTVADTARLGGDGVGAALTLSLQAATTNAGAALAPLPGAVGGALAPLPGVAGAAVAPLPGAVTTPLTPIPQQTAGILNQLSPVIQQAFAGSAVHASIGMNAVAQAVQAGALAVGNSLRVGLLGLPAFVQAAFGGLSVNVAIGMAQIAAAVGNGTSAIANSLRVGLAQLAPVMSGQFGALAVFASIGMAQIAAAVANGMAGVQNSFRIGFVGMASIASSSFAVIVAVVVGGMAAITIAILSGNARMVSSWVAAWSIMTAVAITGSAAMASAVTAGMRIMVAAITSGGNQAVGALRSSISVMVGVLNSSVGAFRTAGANMGNALAAGLRSTSGNVRSAAAELANSAAAATRAAAQIRSPSRVFIGLGEFMGAGLGRGMDKSRDLVSRSAGRMVSNIVLAADKARSAIEETGIGESFIGAFDDASFTARTALAGEMRSEISSDGFGSISDRVGEALEGWQVVIDADGMARLVNKSNTRRARRR